MTKNPLSPMGILRKNSRRKLRSLAPGDLFSYSFPDGPEAVLTLPLHVFLRIGKYTCATYSVRNKWISPNEPIGGHVYVWQRNDAFILRAMKCTRLKPKSSVPHPDDFLAALFQYLQQAIAFK